MRRTRGQTLQRLLWSSQIRHCKMPDRPIAAAPAPAPATPVVTLVSPVLLVQVMPVMPTVEGSDDLRCKHRPTCGALFDSHIGLLQTSGPSRVGNSLAPFMTVMRKRNARRR
eukprot:5377436-Amphidinium_carterae.1